MNIQCFSKILIVLFLWGIGVRAETPFSPPFSLMGARTQQFPPCTHGSASFVIDDGSNFYAIGSGISAFGACVGNRLSVSKVTGNLSPDYDNQLHVNGIIYAITPDGTGAYYIGGTFTKVGNKSRNFIAKINPDGTVNDWDAGIGVSYWNLMQNYTVYGGAGVSQIALNGTDVYFVGSFQTVKGFSRSGFAAVDAAGNVLARTIQIRDHLNQIVDVTALAIHAGTLYIGGKMSSIGLNGPAPDPSVNSNAKFIAAINLSNFTLRPGFLSNLTFDPYCNPIVPGACILFDAVTKIAVNGSSIYVAGTFFIPGLGQRLLAKLDINTGIASSAFNTPLLGSSGNVSDWFSAPNTILFYNNDVILTSSAIPRGIAMYDGTTGALRNDFSAALASTSQASTAVIDGSSLYVVGNLQMTPIPSYPDSGAAAKIDLTTFSRQAWAMPQIKFSDFNNIGFQRPAAAALIGTGGNRLEIVGSFNVMNPKPTQIGVRVNKASFKTSALNINLSRDPACYIDPSVQSGIVLSGKLYLINSCAMDSLGRVRSLTAFSTTNGTPDPNFNVSATIGGSQGYFHKVVTDGTHLYVTGSFDSINGVPIKGIARLSPTTGALDTTWSSNISLGAAEFLGNFVMNSNSIYVVKHTAPGGNDNKTIVRINKTTGAVNTGFNSPTFNWFFISSLILDGPLYVSGGFVDFSSTNTNPLKAPVALDENTGALIPSFNVLNSFSQHYHFTYADSNTLLSLTTPGSYASINKATGAEFPALIDLSPAIPNGFFVPISWQSPAVFMFYEPSTSYAYGIGPNNKNTNGKFRNLFRFDIRTGGVYP